MSAPADIWAVLGGARLRLAANITFATQKHRGQAWVVIHNEVKNQYFRTTFFVKDLITRFDGSKTLNEILAAEPRLKSLFDADPANAAILAKLIETGIVLTNLPFDYAQAIEQKNQNEQTQRRQRWLKPWFVKMPLFNPDRLLTFLNRYLYRLWSGPVFLLWLGLLVISLVAASEHWAGLTQYWHSRFLDPVNFVIVALIYPVLKSLHELAHGLSTKRWGGHVYETGVAWLYFMPVPYVDASASARFGDKWQRVIVSSAGIMTELFLACLAFWIWLVAENLLLRDICFNIMLIGAASSVLFNGNPLLRYDGYYILCDLVEIPNLGSKSTGWLRYWFYTRLFKLEYEAPLTQPGEKKWLFSYGLASGAYRVFISFIIVWFVLGKYFFFGLILGFWALVTQILAPLYRALKNVWESAVEQAATRRVSAVVVSGLALAFGLLFVVPVPSATVAPGVVLVEGEQQIKASTDGFVERVLVNNHQQVTPGQPLVRFKNQKLQQQIALLRARVEEAEINARQYLATDKSQMQWYKDELKNLTQELDDLRQQQDELLVKSHVAGIVELNKAQDLPGRFFSKGEVIGAVVNHRVSAVVVVPEHKLNKIKADDGHPQVVMEAAPDQPVHVLEVGQVPLASYRLPSRFLGSLYGGAVAVDTQAEEGTTAIKPVFELPLSLQLTPGAIPGGRIIARFDHGAEPVGIRLWRALRAQVLETFRI